MQNYRRTQIGLEKKVNAYTIVLRESSKKPGQFFFQVYKGARQIKQEFGHTSWETASEAAEKFVANI